jgi:hypothetical protein
MADKTIDELFEDGTEIDEALARAVRKAKLMHKKLGFPIVVEKNGKIVWIQPEDIVIPDDELKDKGVEQPGEAQTVKDPSGKYKTS